MPSLPLDKLLGGLLIGVIVSSIVYGINCLQVYIYYTENSSRDGRALKTFVGILAILDAVHVALISHSIYNTSVTNFGNFPYLYETVWSLKVQIPVANLIASCVQLFFARRVYHLSHRRNWWIPVIICVISFGQLVGAFGMCFAEPFEVEPWPIISAASNLMCDITITVAMIYYLYRSRTHFLSTNRAINTLITYSLNTGLLTTIFTIVTIAVIMSENQYYTIESPFYFLLARLYPCSLLSTLNCRKVIRATIDRHSSTATSGDTSNSVMQFKSRGEMESIAPRELQEDDSREIA